MIKINTYFSQETQLINIMYHPLQQDPKQLKDLDIESKLSDANKKYNIAARMGNQEACQQIQLIIEQLSIELSERRAKQSEKTLNNVQLNKLINVR
jgi:predicted transcriptional regulator of viral defense system